MNVKRFTARTARDALALVRDAFGDDAVVISTRPNGDSVDVLAMAPESVHHFEQVAEAAEVPPLARIDAPPASVEDDVQQLSMSTLSFQDYVRERLLRRRRAALAGNAPANAPAPASSASPSALPSSSPSSSPSAPSSVAGSLRSRLDGTQDGASLPTAPPATTATSRHGAARSARLAAEPQSAPIPASASVAAAPAVPAPHTDAASARRERVAMAAAPSAQPASARRDDIDLMGELRSMRGLIEQRFGALAFMEKLQREPRQAQLSQKLLDHGFSPALTRQMVDSLPDDVDETVWSAQVLERNLSVADKEPALEDQGGVYALIGSTGVGKTTSTAKLAAAFAARHGATQLGLITLDAYRIAAHEQLRTYGRILGVPVHTAHDRASLEDLLDLLSGKKMVLIDTAGTAQRDDRTRELLEMLSHRAINRLLVLNAAAQGETIEDVLVSYRAATCKGAILSKLDETVKLAPALDALIRHRIAVLAVANGQRVPEDWHRLPAQALVQRALRNRGAPAWRLDASDVNLVFAGLPPAAAAPEAAAQA